MKVKEKFTFGCASILTVAIPIITTKSAATATAVVAAAAAAA